MLKNFAKIAKKKERKFERKMTSNDTVIINLINSRFDALDTRMDALEVRIGNVERKTEELHTEIRAVEKIVNTNATKIEELHYIFGIGIAIIAVVVSIVGFLTTLAPTILEYFKTRRENKITEEKIKSLIDEAVMRALSDRKGA